MTRPPLPPLYRAWVAALRASGIKVGIMHNDKSPNGSACLPYENSRRIIMEGDTSSHVWLFVLLHELAHHINLDLEQGTTRPMWDIEAAADRWALSMIRVLQPDAYDACEQNSRDHLRPILQSWIDGDLRVDWPLAKWAGCTIPDKYAKEADGLWFDPRDFGGSETI